MPQQPFPYINGHNMAISLQMLTWGKLISPCNYSGTTGVLTACERMCLNCANWWEGQPSHPISVTCSAVHCCYNGVIERCSLLFAAAELHPPVCLSSSPTGFFAVPAPYVAGPAAPGVCQPNKQRSPVISSSMSSAWTVTNTVVPEDYMSYAWHRSVTKEGKNTPNL